MSARILTNRKEITVRFNEVDPLGIVWHGNYVTYFEDGRESFGAEFGLRYLDYFAEGFVTPIVDLNINYKKILKYGQKAIVETTYVDSKAAKVCFEYKIFCAETGELLTSGRTIQVFMEKDSSQLYLTMPPFFEEWKKKWGQV